MKFTRQELVNASDVISGMFYCDMTDHLPCFLSIKSKYNPSNTAKPNVRLFGDRNCSKFREMMSTYDWNSLYICNNDWYSAFISVVKRLYLSCFPLVPVFRKCAKDKPWITKGLKKSVKHSHRLYKLSLRVSTPNNIDKYK